MARTLKELAQEAINVQDACNLGGVAHGFARCMDDLSEHTSGTDEKNNHPIARLWADKIAHLSGTQSLGNDAVMAAYSEVRKILGSQ